jgi:hypothetical protein
MKFFRETPPDSTEGSSQVTGTCQVRQGSDNGANVISVHYNTSPRVLHILCDANFARTIHENWPSGSQVLWNLGREGESRIFSLRVTKGLRVEQNIALQKLAEDIIGLQ